MKSPSPEYRVLRYVANPFSGLSFDLGALVRLPDGEVTVLLASRAPSAREVGSQSEASLLESIRTDIAELRDFDRLPRSFGPQFVLTSPQPIPSDDPIRWVEALLFPSAA